MKPYQFPNREQRPRVRWIIQCDTDLYKPGDPVTPYQHPFVIVAYVLSAEQEEKQALTIRAQEAEAGQQRAHAAATSAQELAHHHQATIRSEMDTLQSLYEVNRLCARAPIQTSERSKAGGMCFSMCCAVELLLDLWRQRCIDPPVAQVEGFLSWAASILQQVDPTHQVGGLCLRLRSNVRNCMYCRRSFFIHANPIKP